MKYVRLPQFLADWQALSAGERAMVRQWLAEVFLPAIAAYELDPAGFVWPRSLRFERLSATDGICAVTWSFSGPDGRAACEFASIAGEPHLVWRRIGRHHI